MIRIVFLVARVYILIIAPSEYVQLSVACCAANIELQMYPSLFYGLLLI